ncbi:MAG: two-component regulator propeller domain-containing protein, partial [Bacteroidota bacterium]
EGLLKTTTESTIFQTKTPVNEPNLCSSVILGLDQDSSGDWWVGTKEGLFYQDATGQHSECLSPENTPGMPVPYVINVRALENEIWATFWRGGLGRIRPTELGWAVDTIPGLYELVKGAGMHDIIKDSAGKYWIASPNRGVIRWDPESRTFKVYEPDPSDSSSLSSPYVFHLFFDHKEQLWISTANGGVCRLNPQTELIQCFQQTENSNRSLASNIVLSTYQDQKERIWFCTAAGLSLLLDDGSIRNFGKRDGLPNEVVYGMLEDPQGNLWISTNGGICRISEESDKWSFQNFTAEDGLQSNEFNQYSFHQSTEGYLYFGGSVGLTQFDPTQVQPSNYHPPLEITRLLLFNKEQQVRSSSVLDQSILKTEGISLPHDQNFLAFEFAALGFQQSKNQVYAYRMIGLEEEWIQAGNRRFASYPNLAPGNYRFEVKASNHDGIWSAETKGIDLYVKQPWWKRWWAIL